MPAGTSPSTSLSITNPLILYRTLVATNRIKADPAQHRLALHLQKLYFRLKDYSPEISYRTRLDQIARSVPSAPSHQPENTDNGTIQRLRALFSHPSPLLALTRTTRLHDSALTIDSPAGLLLHGEVGRGKSMLLDLLYSSLPSSKKRRWHFSTFMLDVFRRLERERIYRASLGPSGLGPGLGYNSHEHALLSLAKHTVSTSPILFLDEFQMPDRASSKLVNGFMTAFFHLGGVLVASSNRMPEELAKASGVEFGGGRSRGSGSVGEKMAKSDFGLFVEVLRGRCEVWEMEGERDWRREGEDLVGDEGGEASAESDGSSGSEGTAISMNSSATDPQGSSDTPSHYHITSPSELTPSSLTSTLTILNPTSTWKPTTLHVYSRPLVLPTTNPDLGLLLSPFSSLCASNLGPADYITICSHFHTIVLTSVPVLTILQKNEARRFITLLDALYEAKCRLVMSAEAPPDQLFFPEMRRTSASGLLQNEGDADGESDAITSEAFSEMYQDSTSPFRPNVSMYDERHHEQATPPSSPSLSSHRNNTPRSTLMDMRDTSAAPTYSLHTTHLRNVLADEDADFGPTYGNGRSHGASTASPYSTSNSNSKSSTGLGDLEQKVDFTNIGVLTGEDERFAFKRARSRLWEMCGRRWWREREGHAGGWWTPVARDDESEGRFWEGLGVDALQGREKGFQGGMGMPSGSHDGRRRRVDEGVQLDGNRRGSAAEGDEGLFRHGASPYRIAEGPPPKFGWQHAWGMMRWGKKAGEWGRGVEGDRSRRGDGEHIQDEKRK